MTAEEAVRALLVAIGEDVEREGLLETPTRVAKAWAELTEGYAFEANEVLRTSGGKRGFTGTGYDQMIVLSHYPITSVCEHHMLPFLGHVDIGYLPSVEGVVVGLSKLGRLADMFARRLQIQERLTQQIAQALQVNLTPKGVGVRVRSVHQCMTCRGVRKGGVMVTEALTGSFKDHAVRDEFWHLAGNGA